jgi:hypothetical protein
MFIFSNEILESMEFVMTQDFEEFEEGGVSINVTGC